MATSIKISQLPAKGSNLEATDLLEVSEFNGTGYVSKSITGQEIIDSVPSSVTAWGTITGTLSAQTDLNTALSGKQATVTLTTTGTSGASTFVANTLNVPTYSLSGLGGVPTSRTLTINGTTQDLSADRTFTISTGITIGTTAITSGTVGRVLFEGTGNVVQESANLFWDNTNGRLGIGTATPLTALSVTGIEASGRVIQVRSSAGKPFVEFFTTVSIGVIGSATAVTGGSANDYGLGTNGNATANLIFGTGAGYSERMRIFGSTGNVLINTTTDAGYKLDVNGTARVSTLNFTTNSGFLNVGGNSAVWFADPNNILRLSTSGFVRFNITTTGVVTAPTLNSNLITSTTNVEANNQSIIGYQNQELTNRNINNINKSIFLAQTTGGGSVQNAPVLRYFHALKGNVTGFTSYRGIEVEDMNSFFGTTSGSVGIGANTLINASAILDVTSTTQGFLPPRMTTTQKNAIASPATGLMVYDTTLNLMALYNGTVWTTL